MKKFLVVFVVLAMVAISSMAFAAAEVTVGGSVQVRSRDFSNLSFNKDLNSATTGSTANQVDTQERIMLDVNAKADGVKGKISLWNDFDTWGRNESTQGSGVTVSTTTGKGNTNFFGFREAWVSANIPGIPVNVTAGHQLLQLGHGWFFRAMHFGDDAWVIANVTGPNTVAFVDVKLSEGNAAASDDIDAYVILDSFKLNENMTIGGDLTMVNDRKNTLGYSGGTNETKAQNISLNFTGKLGPVNLKAQADYQMGKGKFSTGDKKLKGNEIIIQGNVPLDPVTINFLLGRGTGAKAGQTDYNQYLTFLDIDPHYTFLYEYKTITAAGAKNTGMSNTTAISVGAKFAAAKSLSIGADVYYLQATEKVANVKSGTGTTSDIGTEVDVTINWQLYDNLSWNWNLGYLKAGDGLGKDDALGAQGVLAFKF